MATVVVTRLQRNSNVGWLERPPRLAAGAFDWYRIRYQMRYHVIVDTNVLIAGLRSRRGASFALLELFAEGAFEVSVSVPLVLEYEAVARRQAREARRSFLT